jgi:hypothetical protein
MPPKADKESTSFLEYVFDLYKSMKTNEVKLVYEGKVTHQITKAFISLAEAQMEENAEAARVQRIVSHVMVECLQNISKHADDYETGNYLYSGKGVFLVSNTTDSFQVTTGNAVLKDKTKAITKLIDSINQMEDPQLKDLYMKQMREGTLSEKGGAGLGLIDIRRKTGNKLDYHFHPLSDKLSFFLLTATIPRNK